MSKEQRISVNVEGSEVVGEITLRTGSDIKVRKICSEYTLTNQCHIPYFSRPRNSFLSQYGSDMATSLLVELHQLHNYLASNRQFIRLQFLFHFRDENYSDMDCEDRFFNSTFPFEMPINLREQVMHILKDQLNIVEREV